jgi:hypothetical protein
MRGPIVGSTVIFYLRITLGLLFLGVGSFKLGDWRAFEQAVAGFRIVPARWTSMSAALIAGLEIAGGGMLVSGVLFRAGAAIVALLLAGFNAGLVVNLLRGRRRLDCQCYGRGTLRVGWGHVAQNAALMGVAGLVGLAPEASITGQERLLVAVAAAEGAALFLAAQHMAGVRAGLIRMLSRIEVE